MNLCKHCRWSRLVVDYKGPSSGLYCLHPEVKVGWCTDACNKWEREVGSDDDAEIQKAN